MYVILITISAISILAILIYEWRISWVRTKSNIEEYMSFSEKDAEGKRRIMKKLLKENTRVTNTAYFAKFCLISDEAKKWFLLNIFLQCFVALFAFLAINERLELKIRLSFAILSVVFFVFSYFNVKLTLNKYDARKKKLVVTKLALDNFGMIFIYFIVIFITLIVMFSILVSIEFFISSPPPKVYVSQTPFLSQRYNLLSQISFTVAIGFLIILSLSHLTRIREKYERSLDSLEKELNTITTRPISDKLEFLKRIFGHVQIITKTKELEKISDYLELIYSLRWRPLIYTLLGMAFFLLPALSHIIPDILIFIALFGVLLNDMINVGEIYGKMIMEI